MPSIKNLGDNGEAVVTITLSLSDAKILLDDCELAVVQGLTFLQLKSTQHRDLAKRMVDLVEFKKRVIDATKKGMEDDI